MRLITDVFAWCRTHVPRWNTISISGYHMREAGCTAVQEVAFTLANGVAYVQAALDAGPRRRRLRARSCRSSSTRTTTCSRRSPSSARRAGCGRGIMRERFRRAIPRSLMLRFHAQTAGSMLTAQQPENNIVRVTVQALAAVLGGCQSLHTNSMDEALALPTERAVRIALRTQQILAARVGRGRHRRSARRLVRRRAPDRATSRRRRGGVHRAGSTSWAGRWPPSASCSARSRTPPTAGSARSRTRARIVVGVNEFVTDDPPPANLFQLDAGVGEALAERLARLRRDARSPTAAQRALDALETAARGPRQPDAAAGRRGRGLGVAGRDLRAAARGVRRPPARR